VKRTLVKSPPELWAELSDAATLAELLDSRHGEIRITRTRPESRIDWSTAAMSGAVELSPSGWGTRVRVTATVRAPLAPADAERTLEQLLDRAGSAHHRPFSR